MTKENEYQEFEYNGYLFRTQYGEYFERYDEFTEGFDNWVYVGQDEALKNHVSIWFDGDE